MYIYQELAHYKKTRRKERATSTQLIKMAKARHLAGVTIFRCSTHVHVCTLCTWPRPPHLYSFS